MSIGRFYNPKPVDFMNKDFTVFMAQQKNNWDLVEESDKKAKDAKTLEGRYVQLPYADGQAVYIVTRHGERTCTLEVVTGIGDDWVVPYIGRKGPMKTDLVLRNIKGREDLEEIFNKRS